MEKQLSEKIEKALRKLMDEDHYKINAFQLKEWLIDAVKLETHKINLLSKCDVSGQVCGTCGSKDVTDRSTYYRCNECDSKC